MIQATYFVLYFYLLKSISYKFDLWFNVFVIDVYKKK